MKNENGEWKIDEITEILSYVHEKHIFPVMII